MRWLIPFFASLQLVGCSESGAGKRQPPTKEENLAVAKRGTPIVNSVYQFKHENGLWPDSLAELAPKYVDDSKCLGWSFQSSHNGRWTLTNSDGFPHTVVNYFHPQDGKAEWQVSSGEEQAALGLAQEVPIFPSVDVKELAKKSKTLILQRIQQKPKQMIHHKGLISILYSKGEFNEASEACEKCLKRWPKTWWPRVMEAMISVKLGKTKEAEERFVAWVNEYDDFNHWFCLSQFYHTAGQKENCAVALQKAVKSKVGDTRVTWNETEENSGTLTASDTAWYAALLAYRENNIELTLAVCDHWDAYRIQWNQLPWVHPLRAACYLKQGKMVEAKRVIQEMDDKWRTPVHIQAESLRKAIESGNTKYIYDPRDRDNPQVADAWNLLLNYQ